MFLSYVRVPRENIANYRWHVSALDGIVAEKPKADRERERETGVSSTCYSRRPASETVLLLFGEREIFSRPMLTRDITNVSHDSRKRFLPNVRGCRNIHRSSPPVSFSRCHASTAASLCKLYASDDLKRIQLFCAREKPLLANLIVNRRVFINVRVRIEQR